MLVEVRKELGRKLVEVRAEVRGKELEEILTFPFYLTPPSA